MVLKLRKWDFNYQAPQLVSFTGLKRRALRSSGIPQLIGLLNGCDLKGEFSLRCGAFRVVLFGGKVLAVDMRMLGR